MAKWKVLIILLITSFYCTLSLNAGGAMGDKPDYKTEIRDKLKKIDISNGIGQKEAIIIAQNYLIDENFSTKELNVYNAKIVNSQLFDNCWVVIFDASFKSKFKSGLKWYSIHIDKQTGKIKSHGWGPS